MCDAVVSQITITNGDHDDVAPASPLPPHTHTHAHESVSVGKLIALMDQRWVLIALDTLQWVFKHSTVLVYQ